MSDKSKLERDPVCGMQVDPACASAKVEHVGRTYFFCCSGCAKKFIDAPEKYLSPKTPSLQKMPTSAQIAAMNSSGLVKLGVPTKASVEYTCPMHPEVRELVTAGK